MKTRIVVTVAAILAFALAGSLSSAWGEPQQESPKKGKARPKSQIPSETQIQGQEGGELGALNDTTIMDHTSIMAQVDSMMQRMDMLVEMTQYYSKSFGSLAEDHHGADKREILMMQRMSDSMGMMAGEIKVSLQQYKEMLEDETASESGSMKAEVHSFVGVLNGLATYIEGAVNTLQTLQERLGQG